MTKRPPPSRTSDQLADLLAAKRAHALLVGHNIDELRKLPEGCVHCVMTSPPYFSLRDYGENVGVFGGDASCKHEWSGPVVKAGKRGGHSEKQESNGGSWFGSSSSCSQCGAWRGQLGRESSPEAYVEHLVLLFREVRRVLHPSGTVWLNLGDSYYGGGGFAPNAPTTKERSTLSARRNKKGEAHIPTKHAEHPYLKPKDMIGIPWLVAFALQRDGWYLRMDVIFRKTNCMPDSVEDRPTKNHEYVFLLAKSRVYYYDADAIREPHAEQSYARTARGSSGYAPPGQSPHCGLGAPRGNLRFDKFLTDEGAIDARRRGSALLDGYEGGPPGHPLGRNKRSVWDITANTPQWDYCLACRSLYSHKERKGIKTREERNENGALVLVRTCPRCGREDSWVDHFAMFPCELVEPCVLAGTSAHGVCAVCSAPWKRVTEYTEKPEHEVNGDERGLTFAAQGVGDLGNRARTKIAGKIKVGVKATTGWTPTCECGDERVLPALVLDPFNGAGTTGIVSRRLLRRYVGCEINPAYAACSEARIAADFGLGALLVAPRSGAPTSIAAPTLPDKPARAASRTGTTKAP